MAAPSYPQSGAPPKGTTGPADRRTDSSLIERTGKIAQSAGGDFYGISSVPPVITAAWFRIPRAEIGTAGKIHGAQLPGR